MDSVFNILVIGFVGLIAYWWANQGLFSAILHLVCVIAAGALAFATWEPASYALISSVPDLTPYAWGIGLLLPFAGYLVVLRVAADKLAPDNLNFPHAVNLGLGGAVGLGSGILTVGIAIIGLGHVHSSNEILGVVGAARSSQTKGQPNLGVQPLWVPAHAVAARFYSFLSETSMSPTLGKDTLASAQPMLEQQSLGLFRDTYAKNGRLARIAAAPGAVRLDKAVLARDPDSGKLSYLLNLHLEPGATTQGQGFALSASQFRLIGRPHGGVGPGSGIAYPSEFAQPNPNGGRGVYKFDDRSFFVTGPAGTQTLDVTLVFPAENFAQNEPPKFLQTMGLRLNLPQIGPEIDAAQAMAMLTGVDAGGGEKVSVPPGLAAVSPVDLAMDDSISPATADLNSLGGGMRVQDENYFFEGTGDYEQGGFRGNKSVVIKGIWAPPNTRVVRLNVSRGGASSIDIWGDRNGIRSKVGDSAKLALVDDLGRTYYPIGFVYAEQAGNRNVSIGLERSGKYFQLDSLPNMSTAGADRMWALFTPMIGRTIVGVKMGDEWLCAADLAVEAKK